MGSFVWDDDIPFSTNNPSDDQPKLLVNTKSIRGILNEDHYSFQSNISPVGDVDGYHRYLHIPVISTLGTPSNAQSANVYTDFGTADPARPNLIFRTDRAPFPVNSIRACGYFLTQVANGAVPVLNGFNIVSITKSPINQYAVVLTTNCVIGVNAIVLGNNLGYTLAANTLTLTLTGSANVNTSFAILQV